MLEIVCCDCAHSVPIAWFVATDKGTFLGVCRCEHCFEMKGDKRSLQVMISFGRNIWRMAVKNGLPMFNVS